MALKKTLALGIDRESWTKASKAARREKRKRIGDNRRGLCGFGTYPKKTADDVDWQIASASTDGVAVCVVLKQPLEAVPPAARPPASLR